MWYQHLINSLQPKIKEKDSEKEKFFEKYYKWLNEFNTYYSDFFFEMMLSIIEKLYFEFSNEESINLQDFANYLLGITIIYGKMSVDWEIQNWSFIGLFTDRLELKYSEGRKLLRGIRNLERMVFDYLLKKVSGLSGEKGFKLTANLETLKGIFSSQPEAQSELLRRDIRYFVSQAAPLLGQSVEFDKFVDDIAKIFNYFSRAESCFNELLVSLRESLHKTNAELFTSELYIITFSFYNYTYQSDRLTYNVFKNSSLSAIKSIINKIKSSRVNFSSLNFLLLDIQFVLSWLGTNYLQSDTDINFYEKNFYWGLNSLEESILREEDKINEAKMKLLSVLIDSAKAYFRAPNIINNQLFKLQCIKALDAGECNIDKEIIEKLKFAVLGMELPYLMQINNTATYWVKNFSQQLFFLSEEIANLKNSNKENTLLVNKLEQYALYIDNGLMLYKQGKLSYAEFRDAIHQFLENPFTENIGKIGKKYNNQFKLILLASEGKQTNFSPYIWFNELNPAEQEFFRRIGTNLKSVSMKVKEITESEKSNPQREIDVRIEERYWVSLETHTLVYLHNKSLLNYKIFKGLCKKTMMEMENGRLKIIHAKEAKEFSQLLADIAKCQSTFPASNRYLLFSEKNKGESLVVGDSMSLTVKI
ncbi:hypothetical protein [Legionella fairfieldensis]|uniref:hypothetical protein n=1 Tax=Legionella fairfieldensis TaxID=45064 RepID=UPI000491CF0E|nr:hypothetical protein [Legionella fairfieldensis]